MIVLKKGIKNCKCKRFYSQPDCDIGWDSSRVKYFNGYHLYIFVASDSFNDLPVFPVLEPASRHDMPSFIHSFFKMQAHLPRINIKKLILDSAHDADPVYNYCLKNDIQPLIDLNPRRLGVFKYKDSFTIGEDGVPICRKGLRMHRDGVETFQKNVLNFVVLRLLVQKDASVITHVQKLNMDALFIHRLKIILVYFAYRLGEVKNGKMSLPDAHQQNVQTNDRKKTIN